MKLDQYLLRELEMDSSLKVRLETVDLLHHMTREMLLNIMGGKG